MALLLVTGTNVKCVHVVDVVTNIKRSIAPTREAAGCALDPACTYLLASPGNEVHLYDAASHVLLASINFDTVCCTFVPHMNVFAVGGTQGEVLLYDPAERNIVLRKSVLASSAQCILASFDGAFLAASTHSGVVTILNSSDLSTLSTHAVHASTVYMMALFRDSDRFVSVSSDRSLKVWSRSAGVQHTIDAGCSLYCVALNDSETMFASGSDSGNVTVYCARTFAVLHTFANSAAISGLAFGPGQNNIYFAVYSHSVKMANLFDWTESSLLSLPGGGYIRLTVPPGRALSTALADVQFVDVALETV
eukprot:m.921327 g.921327  ORF g.921327 m.921327 type:complete len:307 (-) comp83170_c0_seq1:59-979(-)